MGRMYNHVRDVTVLKLSGAVLDRSPESECWLSTDSSFTALRGGARHHTRLPE
jgi:hypothetical protein